MEEEKPKFDAKLEEGVKYFEQMLQLMPEDRTTLEFLVVAYELLGEKEKGEKTLHSLTKILIKQNDIAAAAGLLPRLDACANDEIRVLALKIRRLSAPLPELVPEAPKELSVEETFAEEAEKAIKAEDSLVNLLAENAILTADEAAHLHESLTVKPSVDSVFLISALAVLEKENMELSEKCVAFLADKFKTPPVSVAPFEPNALVFAKFPKAVIRLRGAVPFATLGETTLVAVLNPADEDLRRRFSDVTKCRFFLARPSAVDDMVRRVYPGGLIE